MVMQIHRLVAHPANPSDAVDEVIATIRRREHFLLVGFRPLGRRDEIAWPAAQAPGVSDGLWRHTCFEAFVSAPGSRGYVELNMAPSSRWAAYRFDDYRAGMRPAEAAPTGRFVWRRAVGVLRTRWDMAELPHDADWELGLSAVMETRDGSKSYFALAHAAGPPDFHNRDCFTATLPAPTDT
ncbi:MAG: DOMON-like domain-containing protein [Sphingomonas sp.]